MAAMVILCDADALIVNSKHRQQKVGCIFLVTRRP